MGKSMNTRGSSGRRSRWSFKTLRKVIVSSLKSRRRMKLSSNKKRSKEESTITNALKRPSLQSWSPASLSQHSLRRRSFSMIPASYRLAYSAASLRLRKVRAASLRPSFRHLLIQGYLDSSLRRLKVTQKSEPVETGIPKQHCVTHTL